MMQIQNTVFISYRRSNAPIAHAVRLSLMPHGFDVFFDFESIDNGDFSQIILNQIQSRAHFVLILTPSALERCINPGDWVRQEIEHAIRIKRNVVPLFFEGFEFASVKDYLRGDFLPMLQNYNGLNIYWDYFDVGMERLRERFLSKPVELTLHPASEQVLEVLEITESQLEKQEFNLTPEQLEAQIAFEQGIVKHHKFDYAGAIEMFTKAIYYDEHLAEAYFRRAHSLWADGDLDKAIIDYRTAVDIAPEHPKINILRAYIAFSVDDFETALIEAQQAVELFPELDEVYYLRGRIQTERGKLEAAVKDYSMAISLNPDYVFAYNNRGTVYAQLEQFQNALSDFDKVLSLGMQDALIYNNRGLVYAHLKQYGLACADFLKARHHDPGFQDAIRNFALAYDEMQTAPV